MVGELQLALFWSTNLRSLRSCGSFGWQANLQAAMVPRSEQRESGLLASDFAMTTQGLAGKVELGREHPSGIRFEELSLFADALRYSAEPVIAETRRQVY